MLLRRAHDRARARGHRAAPRTRVRAEPAGSRGGLRQPPPAGSARDRRPDHRPSGRGCPGHVRRGRDVRERARHADDRSPASACVPRPRHGPGRARSVSRFPASRAIGSVRSISRSTRARSSDRGRRSNGRFSFLRALAGAEHSTGTTRCNGNELGVRSPLDALRAGRSGDRVREALFPVLSVRANTTIQVLRRYTQVGLLRLARARRGCRPVRRLKIRRRRSSSPSSLFREETSRRSRSRVRSCAARCCWRSSPTSRPRASTSAPVSTSTTRCGGRRGRALRSSSSRATPRARGPLRPCRRHVARQDR